MLPATIRVLVCGTEFHRVDATLSGTVENTHHAWNRRYDISCVSAPSVEGADTRLLTTCHLVVLTKGALSSSTQNYLNKPTVLLEGAPENELASLGRCEFYYGTYTLDGLRSAVVDIGLSPTHIVWDSELRCLTPIGELGLRRAFWLLDKDADGILSEEELLAWQRAVRSGTVTKLDLHDLFDDDVPDAEVAQVDCARFLSMHRRLLENSEARRVWATLHVTGLHPDGVPYSWRDVHAVRVGKDCNTYLSHAAIQFFRNLYKLRRFQNMDDMWTVTPGCPWDNISGFRTRGIPLDKFIEYWKYMALERREVVVQYARYWGYKGDTGLLFLLRHARPFREEGELLPNTIKVLVLGAPHCGRRSLMFTLTAGEEDFSEDMGEPSNVTYVRTTTFFVRRGEEEVPQSVVYITAPMDKIKEIFTSKPMEKQIDVVLLCYDGGSANETLPFAKQAYLEATAASKCRNLPFLLVMTKKDAFEPSECDVEARHDMEHFCREHRLLWPPLITSVESPDGTDIVSLNEYMYAVAKEPDLALGNPPLTPQRILRRIGIVAFAVLFLGSSIRWFSRLMRRRKS